VGGTYLAQEGLYEFGAKEWGPQRVRLLLINNSDALLTILTARDAGIRTAYDLKGKRVAWVAGAPSLNQNITAMLAFANLTWADVTRVEFGGFGAAMDGIVANQVDAAFASSIAGQAYKIAASPRGLQYPVFAHADKAGWERMRKVAPFFVPFMGTEGAGMSKESPVEGATYPYPTLIAYAGQDAGLVQNMTRAMIEFFPDYKDAAPGNNGWDLKRQIFDWVVPYHDGAIAALREIGAWKPEHQAHNDRLVQRQEILINAWSAHVAGAVADEKAFYAAWLKRRAAALAGAGFDPVVTE